MNGVDGDGNRIEFCDGSSTLDAPGALPSLQNEHKKRADEHEEHEEGGV
jgi:hypothetical protein